MDFDSSDETIQRPRYKLNTRVVDDKQNYSGRVLNVMGNVQIPFTLPDGDNECIGSVYVDGISKLFFFIWNSNDKHSIYEYDEATNVVTLLYQAASLNFNLLYKITQVDYVPNDILTWTDGFNEPSKLLIERGRVTFNGNRKWNVYFDKRSLPGGYLNATITFKDATAPITLGPLFVPPQASMTDLIDFVTTAFGGGGSLPITVTSCDCSIDIEAKNSNVKDIQFAPLGSYDVWSVANNFYPEPYANQYIQAIPYTPLTQPSFDYVIDPSVSYNRVSDNVFQFAYRYEFNGCQYTSLSPYSLNAFNNKSCGSIDIAYNAIDINLINDTMLLDKSLISLVESVEIFFRTSLTGKWYRVGSLSQCDLITQGFKFRFYNDGQYSILADAEALKPYDAVPITAKAQSYVKNHLFYGNTKEEYPDIDCLDASVEAVLTPIPVPKTYKATARIRIFNRQALELNDPNLFYSKRTPIGNSPFQNGLPLTYYSSNMPIFKRENFEYPVFGGIKRNSTLQDTSTFQESHGQILPEGGWPVYCAGTDHWALSKQSIAGLENVDGVITDVSALEAAYDDPTFDCYSIVTIEGLAPGKYTIRVGSHWCSYGDKLGKGRMFDLQNGRAFQKTSSQVIGVTRWEDGGTYLPTELNVFEIEVTITDHDVFAGDFIVWDMIDMRKNVASANYTPMHVYLYDTQMPDGTGGYKQASQLSQYGVAMESQYVWFPPGGSRVALVTNPHADILNNPIYFNFSTTNTDLSFLRVTDHNGFCCSNWYAFDFYEAAQYNDLGQRFRTPGQLLWVAIGQDTKVLNNGIDNVVYRNAFNLYSGSKDTKSILNFFLNEQDGVDPNIFDQRESSGHRSSTVIARSLAEFIIPNYNEGYSRDYRTTVSGRTVSSTLTAANSVDVVVEGTGRTSLSDRNGEFRILIYASVWDASNFYDPLIHTYLSYFYKKREQNVLFYSNKGCINDYQQYRLIDVSPFITTYNNTNFFLMGNCCFFVDRLDYNHTQQFKQFGRYKYGIHYLDEAGRRSVVYTKEQLDVRVPGMAGTGSYQYPQIVWNLAAPAPDWAVAYQWVRTPDLSRNSYLQWAVNDVKFIRDYKKTSDVDEFGYQVYDFFPAPQNEAAYIWLDLYNLYAYKKRYPNSDLGYTYQKGDKVIFIAKANGEVFSKYYELDVIGFVNAGILVENVLGLDDLTSGVLVEIYSPKKTTDDNELVFYEFGEKYDIVDGLHTVTTGYFQHGDTYTKRRFIDIDGDITSFSKWYVVENKTASDFFASDLINIGRVNTTGSVCADKADTDKIRWGNKHIENSGVNNLFSFELLDTKSTSKSYGAITALVGLGDVLIAQHEKQTISFYIEQQIFRNVKGQDVVGVTASVIDTYNVITGGFGCVNGESVSQHRNNFVAVDAAKGCVFRYGGNGTIDISGVDEQNKSNKLMYGYFHKKLNDIINTAGYVLSSFDMFLKEWVFVLAQRTESGVLAKGPILPYYYFVLDGTDQFTPGEKIYYRSGENIYRPLFVYSWDGATRTLGVLASGIDFNLPNLKIVKIHSDTVAFSEMEDYWSTFYSYNPDAIQRLNNGLVSWKNGTMWMHHKNPLRNNFYGVQDKSQVRVVFNMGGEMVKVWHAFMIHQEASGFHWSVPTIKNGLGQLSRILQSSFKKLEYFYYSAFKKDLNTVSVTNPIVNGKELRSTTLDVTLENDSTGNVELVSVTAEFQPSERTLKY